MDSNSTNSLATTSDINLIINKLERLEIEILLFSLSIICILSYLVYSDCWFSKNKKKAFQYENHVLMPAEKFDRSDSNSNDNIKRNQQSLICQQDELKTNQPKQSTNLNKLELSDSLFLINESEKNTSNSSLSERYNKNQIQLSAKKSNLIRSKINRKLLNGSSSDNSKFKYMTKEKSSENLKITSKMKRSHSLDPNSGVIETNVSTVEELIEEKTLLKKKVNDSQELPNKSPECSQFKLLNDGYLHLNLIQECELDHTPSRFAKSPINAKNYKCYNSYINKC